MIYVCLNTDTVQNASIHVLDRTIDVTAGLTLYYPITVLNSYYSVLLRRISVPQRNYYSLCTTEANFCASK